MKKFIAFTSLIITLMIPAFAFGEELKNKVPTTAGITSLVQEVVPEPSKIEKDIGAALSPLKKSQIAPFSGVLLSPLAVAKLIAELNSKAAEIELEAERAKKEAEAKFQYEKTIFQNQCNTDKSIIETTIIGKNEQLAALDAALKQEIESRPNPVIWAFVGLAAGVVASTATASIIVATSN